MLNDLTDEELMLQIQKRDRKACEKLVKRHFLPVSRFAAHMLGSASAAEDAIQETFLKVWSKAHQWKSGKASVSTWLHTITHNICIDHLRKDKSKLTEIWSDDHNSGSYLENDLHASENAKQVSIALDDLPENQRTAIILCYYRSFSNRDAAQVTGISVRALESLLARARRALKKALLPKMEVSN